MLIHEIVGSGILLCLFLGVIALAEWVTRKQWLAPEPARKSIHVTGGLGCVLFPFLVESWVSVLVLALLLALVLHLGEHSGKLRALASVDRKSYGSLLFPLAILFLFVMGQERLWLYVSALLVLVLADTAAALAGTRFGVNRFATSKGQMKSLEGTAMFGVVGFLCVYLSLLFLSDIPHVTCILTALLMAILLAGLEAVSIGGTDNLFVPIGTCFLLLKISTKPQTEILFQCISFLVIAGLVFVMNHRSQTFRTRPLIIFILACYATWTLGSAEWMLPMLVGFTLYLWFCRSCEPLPSPLSARQLLRPLYPLLIILFFANAKGAFDFWFVPFIVACASTTSMCIESRFRLYGHGNPLQGARLWTTLLLPSLLSLLACLPAQGTAVFSVLPFVVPLCALAGLAYHWSKLPTANDSWGNYAITVYSGLAALVYAGLQQAGAVQPLSPLTWMEVFR